MFKHIILSLLLLSVATASAQTPWRTDYRHSADTLAQITPQAGTGGHHRAMDTRLDNGLGAYGESAKGSVPSVGSPLIPVIMVAYSDLDFLPSTDATKLSRWLGEEGYHDEPYAVGSVADYFRDNSYGLFTPRFEVVARVTLANGCKYYGAHSGGSNDVRPTSLVSEAIGLAVAQGVDFSRFATDGHVPIVSIVHAGPGEQEDFGYQFPGQSSDDYIWAHYRPMTNRTGSATIDSYIITNEAMRYFDSAGNVTRSAMTGIGTFCHEFCHALGLADHYDVNGSSGGSGHTPGLWDVMDYQFMLDGYRPSCLSAYERCCLGWLDIPLLPFEATGAVALLPLDAPAADDAEPYAARAYLITHPDHPTQHIILENRQPSPWHVDRFGNMVVLGTGMLAWSIDYDRSAWSSNAVNTLAAHQRVAVIPADGAWQQVNYGEGTYPGDPFPGTHNVTTFSPESITPSALSFYFDALREISEGSDGRITFRFDSPTGLSAAAAAAPGVAYDLSGRRLREVPESGLYIEGGKLKRKR